MSETRIGVVGGGNMAGAIIRGCLDSGRFPPAAWAVAEPNPERRARVAALGVDTAESAADLVAALDPQAPLLLAVKPQSLDDVARDLAGAAAGRVVISILAGTPSSRIRAALGAGDVRVVRVMPNVPAQVGRGTSAISSGAGARPGDDALAHEIFSAIGTVVRIDESLMDAFTAVAGSGPAYLFLLAEGMVEGAQRVGFDAEPAETIVRSVLSGSSLLLEASDQSASDLRRTVTSKGGTTEAALEVLEGAGLADSVARAIVAARDRGISLAGGGR